jgi:hypothetical protein
MVRPASGASCTTVLEFRSAHAPPDSKVAAPPVTEGAGLRAGRRHLVDRSGGAAPTIEKASADAKHLRPPHNLRLELTNGPPGGIGAAATLVTPRFQGKRRGACLIGCAPRWRMRQLKA